MEIRLNGSMANIVEENDDVDFDGKFLMDFYGCWCCKDVRRKAGAVV